MYWKNEDTKIRWTHNRKIYKRKYYISIRYWRKIRKSKYKYIKQYENSKNVKIYHVIKQKTESKDISIFLYVNSNSKNWENEKRDIKLGYDCAIVYTKEEQIREIGIVNKKGKIARIVI